MACGPKLRQSVVPVYTKIAATEPLSDNLVRSVMPSGSVLYEVAHNTIYYRLDRWNRLLTGGLSIQRDAADLADGRHLIAYAGRLWPHLKHVSWTRVWNGQVAITTDHHILMHEPVPGVHIRLGYNGRGVAMATAMGSLLARRIAGADRSGLPMPVTDLAPVPIYGLAKIDVAFRLTYGRVPRQVRCVTACC